MTKASRHPGGRVTVKNIADDAGVSIGAVSSVLSNRHVERRISAETVERIRAAALKLGYLPNISARRLRSGSGGRSNVVVAFITSYEAPLSLVNDLILSLRQAVSARGRGRPDLTFSFLIEMFAAGQLKDLPGLLGGEHFNAAIIANTTPEDDQFLGRVHLPFPVVLVNRAVPRYSCVVEDPLVGGRAAGMLLERRRRHLAVLYGQPLTQATRERVNSFMTMVTQQLGRPPQEIVADNLSEAAASDAMASFLAQGGKLNGLYAVTDGLALGAYHAILERDLRISEDVAVVGVGDYDSSAYFVPPLSVAGVERSEIGKEAGRLLLRQLEQPGLPPLKVEIPAEPVWRESTGRA